MNTRIEKENSDSTLREKLKPPRRFKVLLHNDDYTSMEFVVMILTTVFYHSEVSAVKIMLKVHNEGSGAAGVFSREEAESKIAKVSRFARENQFPLRCSMEPEEE